MRLKIGVVMALFNSDITDKLLQGTLKELAALGVLEENIIILQVPGSFEIPLAVKALILDHQPDAVVCLGALIKGETDHYHYISKAVTNGIMSITLEFELPYIIFGVLTCQNKDLAIARSGENINMNKGYEAGLAAAKLLNG